MPRDANILSAKTLLHQTMKRFHVDNARDYEGGWSSSDLIDFGDPTTRVNTVRQNSGYTRQKMLAWGKDVVTHLGGNCDDFAAATCYLLHSGSFPRPFVHAQAPGHAFVVVDLSGDINESQSWTNETFIIDYWLRGAQYSRHVSTVWVEADLLCDIPRHQEQRVTTTSPDLINVYISDFGSSPGDWYSGHRKNGKLKSMTGFP